MAAIQVSLQNIIFFVRIFFGYWYESRYYIYTIFVKNTPMLWNNLFLAAILDFSKMADTPILFLECLSYLLGVKI